MCANLLCDKSIVNISMSIMQNGSSLETYYIKLDTCTEGPTDAM